MSGVEKAQPQRKKRSLKLAGNLILLLIAFGLVCLAWKILQAPPKTIELPNLPPFDIASTDVPADMAVKVYVSELDPLISLFTRRNEAAEQRALQALHDEFQKFQMGIEPFVEDMTRYGTRFGVLGRMAGDQWDKWWNKNENTDRVKSYINEKFREHVLSEEALESAITAVFAIYANDVTASRNQLLSEAGILLSTDDVPLPLRFHEDQAQCFGELVQTQVARLLRDKGERSAAAMLLNLIAGEIATSVATSAAGLVLTQAATRLAVPAGIAGGTAMVSGGAAGGGAGTALGPAGTIVGFGAGIIVGCAIDWWMTERFKEQMSGEIAAFLDSLESQIVKGIAEGPAESNGDGAQQAQGLITTLTDATLEADRIMRTAMLTALVKKGGQ